MTEERDQCVRDMSGWMDNGETLSQAICAMRLSASTFKQQLATVTQERDLLHRDNHALLAEVEDWRQKFQKALTP